MVLNNPRLDDPVFGSSQRVKLNTTSSALKSSPFDHLTSLRRWKVQVFRSSEASQLSARPGLVTLSGPVSTIYSTICLATTDFSVHEYVAGSAISCTTMPNFRSPPFFWPAWAVEIRSGKIFSPSIVPARAYAVAADMPNKVVVRKNSRREHFPSARLFSISLTPGCTLFVDIPSFFSAMTSFLLNV